MEMAAAAKGRPISAPPEWRVTVPEGASVAVEHEAAACRCRAARAWAWLVSCVLAFWDRGLGFGRRVWRIGADDPRRAVHGLKVGLALTLVSVFYYSRTLYDGVGGAAMWAVLTVVVVFEYTVGKLCSSTCTYAYVDDSRPHPMSCMHGMSSSAGARMLRSLVSSACTGPES
jgi:hypothetical protein